MRLVFVIVSRTRTNLLPDEFAELGRLDKAFYEDPPLGISLYGDRGATEGSRMFALIEAELQGLLRQVQEPFRRFVDMALVPVKPLQGWSR